MISELPLLVFTVLTGIAAGAYVGAAVFPAKDGKAKPWLFPLIALILVAVGGLSAMGHLGRPQLMLNVLNNPTSSLTMEGLSAGVLALVALVDLILCKTKAAPNRAVRIVGAVVGIACMCIVTSAYAASYGNPAWTATPTYPLFLVGDLAAGIAFWMLFAGAADKRLAITAAVLGVLFAIVLVWQAAVFVGLGEEGFGAIVLGAVLAAAGAVGAFAAATPSRWHMASGAAFVLIALALVASRYGFYLASII